MKQGSKNELNSMLLNLGSGASLATFATRVRNRPYASYQNSLRQESTLLSRFRLSICDAVDDEANTTLRDDIGDAVSHLDGHNCVRTREADHWEDVHNWVCQPANTQVTLNNQLTRVAVADHQPRSHPKIRGLLLC